jgi:hypothetical protein
MASRLFGPSKSEIWRQLSDAIGGEYSDSGWGARRGVVRATHGVWTVTLDSFVVMAGNTPILFTRMRAPFVSQTGFRFSIRRRSLLTDVATKLGMQDLEIGDEAFDRAFVIKGTEPTLVQELFADAQVRQLIDAQPDMHLLVKDDEGWFGAQFPDGVDELYFAVRGIIKDVERLKALFDLFAEVLDRLCRIGAAQPSAPGVTL